MNEAWDHEFDLVVVGSGAAGMSAALRCASLGGSVVILEASDHYGGSTAISGGVVWIPDNPDMHRRGVSDSRDEALAYLRAKTEGTIAEERLVAYVDNSKRVLAWLEANSWFRLDALEKYSDYYPEEPGGKTGGRSMEPTPFDASELGEEFFKLRAPHKQSQVMGKFGITAREAAAYIVADWKSRLKLMMRFWQYALRWFKRRKFHRDTKLHAGNALIARLRRSLMDHDVPIWLETPMTELVIDGRVEGVVAGGKRIRGRHGVLLAAGGFERNQQMRDAYQPSPISTDWNAGNPRNLGDGIRIGQQAGADVSLMDEAWWTPVTLVPRSEQAWVLVVEKSLPGSLMVNSKAQRFVNEAAPYLDVAKAMYAHDAVPDCFMIFDAQYRKSYPVGPLPPGYALPDASLSKKYTEGFLIKAKTLPELAEACGLDATALQATIEHYNQLCDAGLDSDFGRGESATDRYYADPRVGSNPCLRALRDGPFYAIRVYPGDLGTKGGLVTDADARVLDPTGTPIPGLYAAGNNSASVMGPTYPGAGGTIGPALTFGFIAAETAKADAEQADAPVAAAGGA